MRKNGANVKKKFNWKIAMELGEFPAGKRSGPGWKDGPACPFQVFTDVETATNTARFFSQHLGGVWGVRRCDRCKLIHLQVLSRVGQSVVVRA